MEKGKFALVFCMILVLILGAAASIYMNVSLSKGITKLSEELKTDLKAEMSSSAEENKKNFARIDDYIEKMEEEGKTKEDNVKIAGSYEILPTTQISDAYKSGDDSGLSDKDKETLKMASDVIKDIIKDGMTDYEKELAVYEWLTMYTSQDRGMLLPVQNTEQDADNPYGVLKYKNAVCVGYATTFRMFMQMLDIECMVVHNTENYHSWDLIKLDGEWYHTDVFSDAGNTSHRHFNMSDSECGQQWDREFFPAATGKKYNYKTQNSKEIKNIYKLPKTVKKMLERKKSNAKYYFMTNEEAQENYRVVESLLSKCQERVNYESFGDVGFYWDWTNIIKDGKQGYCLGVYADWYGGEVMDSSELTEEQIKKIDGAVTDAFGEQVGVPPVMGDEGMETSSECIPAVG